MDEIVNDAGSADSSPAPETQTADPAQAPTQPVQPKGFHEHPDWQRMVASRREDRAVIGQLQQKIAQFERAQQQSQPGQPPSAEEQNALVALERLIKMHPKLARMFDLAEKAPQYEQRFQGMDQMRQAQERAHMTAARSSIKELAAADGLPTDDASLRHIVRLVAGEAMSLDQGNERYQAGDLSVLKEAFDAIKPWLASMRKPAQDTLAQTKTKLKGLPPPPRGGAAGSPAFPSKPEPGKEKEFEKGVFARGRAMMERLSQQG